MRLLLTYFGLLTCCSLFAQTPCENGSAGGYPCNQVSLYARVLPEDLMAPLYREYYLNDIWGWTDPENGKEYAIVGVSDGVTFVDITSPSEPVVIGKLAEPATAAVDSRTAAVQHGKSRWRDMKTYKNHVFIVSDLNAAHGMQVFDLTKLRDFDGSEFQEFTSDAWYDGVNSAHNIVINESTGYAYIVGATNGSYCNQGGLHIVDINDPKNPQYLTCFDSDGYTHDAQCVIYQGPDTDYAGTEVCFNSNEDTFTIVNVDDKENMELVSRTGYEEVNYNHQGWVSEDHQFFLQNDEGDELEYRYNARTLIWDIRDLDNPIYLGSYFNNAEAIDHNLYIHQGLVYESNYLSGLRILSTDRLAAGQMREVAFFDTFPEADIIAYGGSWSNYPFFESGTIAVSDMTGGLFLLKLDTTTYPITIQPVAESLCEGTKLSMQVITSAEDLSYQWEYFDDQKYLPIEGATAPMLDFPAEEELSGRIIRCKVTGSDSRLYYSYPASFELSGYLPDLDFSFFATDNSVSFSNETTNADRYEWDFGDGNGSTETNPVHEYETTGVYEVKLTAFNDCGSKELVLNTSIVTGINDEFEVNIYPNPASGKFTINYPQPFSVRLYHSITGQLMLFTHSTNQEIVLDGAKLAPGMYLLELKSNAGSIYKKVLIR